MTEDLFEIEPPEEGETSKGKAGAEASAILLRLYVHPGAGRAAVTGRRGDALHVRVAPPPVDGRANVACIELVAELLGVPQSAVEIVSGERSRLKRLRIQRVEVDQVRRVLDRAVSEAETHRGGPRNARTRR
ncbi:MAG: DUF167 domain-containing protein [Acidimicrobiales bacterium]